MAKEFDIYLNKRLTECDIIVYSIPFRDGLTATNRMILESCLESYTLQKFIAVETGSELVSHIDKMIKTCNERLHMASTWGIDLEFQTHYVLNPVPTVIEIAPNDDEMSAFLFSLGCYSGEPITVVARKRRNLVVSIKDARYNIDIELAKAILI